MVLSKKINPWIAAGKFIFFATVVAAGSYEVSMSFIKDKSDEDKIAEVIFIVDIWISSFLYVKSMNVIHK